MPRRYWRTRIRDHRDEYDAVVLTSVRGSDLANPMAAPYLGPDEPTGQGCEVDLLTGRTTVGATTIRLVDAVAVVATDPTVLEDPLTYPDDAALFGAYTHHGDGTVGWGVARSSDPARPDTTAHGKESGSPTAGVLTTVSAADNYLDRLVTGLIPGASYTVSVEAQGWGNLASQSMGVFANGLCPVGSYYQGAFYELPFFRVTQTFTADASGTATVGFGLTLRATGEQMLFGREWWFRNLRVVRTLTANADGTVTPPSTVTGRVLTAAMADAQARQHLLSRKVIVEVSSDEVP